MSLPQGKILPQYATPGSAADLYVIHSRLTDHAEWRDFDVDPMSVDEVNAELKRLRSYYPNLVFRAHLVSLGAV